MRDFFHWEGTLPEWKDRFNKAVTEGAMVLYTHVTFYRYQDHYITSHVVQSYMHIIITATMFICSIQVQFYHWI